ncbi:MAG TPA: sigma-E processing peptidase SpoIIGA [Bacilli bacterium]|nr:sigma-E processing peptidase SpoIIGA [Bacilli bacterium]
MKIYLDLVLVLNFIFDLIILITVSYVLKRNVKSINFILGGLLGSLTTLFLFIDINSIELFFFKLVISILMTIITFSYRNIRYTLKNLSYLYIVSIILGGFLYFLNITFSYKHDGLIFYNNGLSINFIFLIIFSPIILIMYSKQVKELKNNYSNYYKVDIYLNKKIIKTNAYLDTGNKLVDCYLKRPVLILNKKKMIYDINKFKMVLVPYKTIGNTGLLKCIIPDKIYIKGIGETKKVLIGISNEDFKINGIDLILNTRILEDI